LILFVTLFGVDSPVYGSFCRTLRSLRAVIYRYVVPRYVVGCYCRYVTIVVYVYLPLLFRYVWVYRYVYDVAFYVVRRRFVGYRLRCLFYVVGYVDVPCCSLLLLLVVTFDVVVRSLRLRYVCYLLRCPGLTVCYTVPGYRYVGCLR